jgi:hypothetical protein
MNSFLNKQHKINFARNLFIFIASNLGENHKPYVAKT